MIIHTHSPTLPCPWLVSCIDFNFCSSALRAPHSLLRAPHSLLRTPHSLLHAPRSVLHAPRSVLHIPHGTIILDLTHLTHIQLATSGVSKLVNLNSFHFLICNTEQLNCTWLLYYQNETVVTTDSVAIVTTGQNVYVGNVRITRWRCCCL